MAAPSPTSGGTAEALPRERARASFDPAALHALVKGRRKGLNERFRPLFAGAPFDGTELDIYRSYEELYRVQLRRVAAAFRVTRDNPEFRKVHMARQVRMADMVPSQPLGVFLHFTMFLTFVESQASDEQKRAWLPAARAGKFLGAYAQTELGHGSNVRGLETLATYDAAAGEFEIHSPTLTSLKWWPTGMYACTHAVVFAQLVSGGKSRGTHGFMVQLRGPDGRPMPGVELGEIGPKLNAQETNIGYARFTRVRVPRFNMFARHSRVTADGTFVAAPSRLSKFKYISMMRSRVSIVSLAFNDVAKAATIAVRFSAVRRQGFKDTGGDDPAASGEHAILDYQMQQYRLFRAVGLAYQLFFNKKYITEYLNRVQRAINAGDDAAADAAAGELPDLHATLSGMKAVASSWAHASIEECRKCCGGLGFLASSGVAQLSPNFAVWVTGEGTPELLSLQLGRYLVKMVGEVAGGGSAAGVMSYLNAAPAPPRPPAGAGGDAVDALLGMYEERAARYARKLAAGVAAARRDGLGFDDAMNATAVLGFKATECHTAHVMAQNAVAGVRAVADPAVRAALRRVLELSLAQHAAENAGDWAGGVDDAALDHLRARVARLLREVRPDAVALVDGLGFGDAELKSTLGRRDGNVYEAVYDDARRSPLNRPGAMVGWADLAPALDVDWIRASAKGQHARPAPSL